MHNKTKRSPEEWMALVVEWESSNQSQPVFCREKGVSHAAFQYWRAKRAETQRQPAEQELVEVTLTKSPEIARENNFRVIFPSGIAVETGRDFQSEDFVRLLHLIRTL